MLKDDTPKSRELRRQCHYLLDEVFEGTNKAVRYNWLDKMGYSHHMADMNDAQLEVLKQELILVDEKTVNVYKKKKK